MKKFFLIIFCALISISSAFAQKGEKAVGVNLGYGTEISNLGIGVKYQHGITDAIRLEGGFDYFLKKDGLSMWDINVNAHYLFPVAEKFKVYPLVGLTYTNWKGGAVDDALDFIDGVLDEAYGEDDYTEGGSGSESRFGANLGAGVQYDITTNWAVNFEVKYQLIKDCNQAVFTFGAAYKF